MTILWPCFLCLLLTLSTTEGSVSDTDNFLLSRLPFSWSPSWGAEQTLFSPSSPQPEPWIRSECALLRLWRSRLSQRLWIKKQRQAHVGGGACDKKSSPQSDCSIWLGNTSWPSGWMCAEVARTWCCLWAGLGWSAIKALLRKWGDELWAVSLRPSLTFSSSGKSRLHRICVKQSVWHFNRREGKFI